MSSGRRSFEQPDTPGPGGAPSGDQRQLSFLERYSRDRERRRAADLAADRNKLPIARAQLESAQQVLIVVQGLQQEGTGYNVADQEIERLINAVNPTKDFLKSHPDLFESKYDIEHNTTDREYHEARMAWYQYKAPDAIHKVQKLAKWAQAATDANTVVPYPANLVHRYIYRQYPDLREIGRESMAAAVTEPGFKTFIKREVIRTAQDFLVQAGTRLGVSMPVRGQPPGNVPLPLYSADDPSGNNPSGSGS
jgi:hypothetical protein